MKRKFFKNKIILNHALTMLAILIVPLVFSIFFYTYTLDFALNKIEEKSYAGISSVRDIIDRDILYIQKTTFKIIQEADLMSIPDAPTTETEINNLRQLTNYFSSEINSNDFIKNIYVYYNDDDIIVSADGKYRAEDFHTVYVKNKKFSTWKNQLKQTYFNSFMTKQDSITIPNTEVIEYRQSFPLSEKKDGTLVILLDIAELDKLFLSQSHAPDSAIYILNENNDVLFHTGQTYSVINDIHQLPADFTIETSGNFLLCRNVSDETSLQYISIENKSTMLKKFYKISYLIVFYIIFVICAGFIYIVFVSKKAYQPIDKINNILNTTPNEISWSTIHMFVQNLKNANQRAENILSEQKSSLNNQFLMKIITGKFSNNDNFQKECQTRNIAFHHNSFLIVLSSFNSVSEEDCPIIKIAISNIMADLVESKATVYSIDSGIQQITFLINFDEALFSYDEIVSCCQFLNVCIKNEFEHDILFNMGTIEKTIDDVYISAQKAKEAYESRIMNDDTSIICSTYNDHHSNLTFYSLEQENKLINYVISGQKESAIFYLNQLITEYSDSSLPMLKYFFFGLTGTAYKLINLLDNDSRNTLAEIKLEKVLHSQNLKELKNAIEKTIDITCSELVTKKNRKQQIVSTRMLEYVGTHSSEYDMSLEKVAQHFDLSATYVSRFFKEQIHENFSTYLTKIRIQKAKKLLKETSLDVNEIASNVGYSASTVFIKNFKKLEQMTPGAYRSKYNAEN